MNLSGSERADPEVMPGDEAPPDEPSARLNRCPHLMPGNEDEAAALLDAYLTAERERAAEAARAAAPA